MSFSVLIIIALVVVLCVYVFNKTVSNNGDSDYRLKDILAASENDEEGVDKENDEGEEDENDNEDETFNFDDVEPEIIERDEYMEEDEEVELDVKNDFQTKVHESPVVEVVGEESEEEQEEMEDEFQQIQENSEQPEHVALFNKSFKEKIKKEITIRKSMFDYVNIFWRGITFAIGIIVCLFSFNGIMNHVQTSEQAIVYSIWLLIGVILLK